MKAICTLALLLSLSAAAQPVKFPTAQGAPLVVGPGGNWFDGVFDDVLIWGFNTAPDGGKLVEGVASLCQQLETNYQFLGNRRVEYNFDFASPDGRERRRFTAFQAFQTHPDDFTDWRWACSGVGGFHVSSAIDVLSKTPPTDYFSVWADGRVESIFPLTVRVKSSTAATLQGTYRDPLTPNVVIDGGPGLGGVVVNLSNGGKTRARIRTDSDNNLVLNPINKGATYINYDSGNGGLVVGAGDGLTHLLDVTRTGLKTPDGLIPAFVGATNGLLYLKVGEQTFKVQTVP